MSPAEFRALVHRHFGADLERMTPANVREFLDAIYTLQSPVPPGERIALAEPAASCEGVFKDFFRRMLDLPPEQAIVPLWLFAVELAFADLTEALAGEFDRWFAPSPADDR